MNEKIEVNGVLFDKNWLKETEKELAIFFLSKTCDSKTVEEAWNIARGVAKVDKQDKKTIKK